MSDDILTVISNASTDVYPTNTLTDFRNDLPRRDGYFKANTQICLSSMCISNRFINVPRKLLHHSHHLEILRPRAGINSDVEVIPITMPIRHYESIHEFIEIINRRCPLSSNRQRIVEFKISNNTQAIVIHLIGVGLQMLGILAKWLAIPGADNKDDNNMTLLSNPATVSIFGLKSPVFKDRTPSFIRVQIDQLEGVIGDERNRKSIALLALDRAENGNYKTNSKLAKVLTYQTTLNEYCGIKWQQESVNLRVRLLDEKGLQLLLDIGQPSLLRFRLTTMNRQTFMLRLSSKDPNNEAEGRNSSFRHPFQQPLQTGGIAGENWQLALTSILFPSSIAKYKTPLGAVADIILIGYNEKNKREIDHSIKLEKEHFKNKETLIKYIKEELTRVTLGKVILSTSDDGNRLSLRLTGSLTVYIWMVKFTKTLAYILGLTPSTTETNAMSEINSRPLELHSYIDRKFEYHVDINRLIPNIAMIYSDIVKCSQLGSGYANIVKYIPLKMTDSQEVTTMYEADMLEWVNLSKNHITSILLEMRQVDGQEVQFENDQDEVLYSFAFRTIQ